MGVFAAAATFLYELREWPRVHIDDTRDEVSVVEQTLFALPHGDAKFVTHALGGLAAAMLASAEARAAFWAADGAALLVPLVHAQDDTHTEGASRALSAACAGEHERICAVVRACGWRGLARMASFGGVDSAFFTPHVLDAAAIGAIAPRAVQVDEGHVVELLSALEHGSEEYEHQHEVTVAVQSLATLAESKGQQASWAMSAFEEEDIWKEAEEWICEPEERDFLVHNAAARALAVLASHKHNHAQLVERGGLDFLHALASQPRVRVKMKRQIARCLANLAVDEHAAERIVCMGFLAWLTAWVADPSDVKLRAQAYRALLNLHHEGPLYGDGVHLLCPHHACVSDKQVDIVFVHGLRGGAFKTWRTGADESMGFEGGCTDPGEKLWHMEWIGARYPHARVISLDYKTTYSSWYNSTLGIADKARLLLPKLVDAGIGQRPTIFVMHSLGGLVTKQMLHFCAHGIPAEEGGEVMAREVPPEHRRLLESVIGMVFFGTPHNGLDKESYFYTAQSYITRPTAVWHDMYHHQQLAVLNESLKAHAHIPVLSFGEKQETNVAPGITGMVVPVWSANPNNGTFILVDTNHFGLCKPTSRDAPQYIDTVAFLDGMLRQHGLLEPEKDTE